jgi:cytochrome c6
MMRTRQILGSIVFATFFFTSPAAVFAAAQHSRNALGHDTFKARCATCHGTDGRASTSIGKSLHAADLHSAKVQRLSNTAIASTIRNGKGNMPPFGGLLSSDEVHALVRYVRSLGKAR